MERDMLLREFSALGLYSKPNRYNRFVSELPDYQVAISLKEDPNTVVQEAAVLPFSVSDRQCLYVDLLSNAGNLKQTKANSSKLKNNAILGVNIQNIITQLKRYVDFDILEKALKQYRSDIVINSNPVNALFTEAIHQFQAKIFTDSKEWDGIIGPATMSSLGFIFHLDKGFRAKSAKKAISSVFKEAALKDSIERYKTSLNVPTLNGITGDNWFDYIINPTLLGWRGDRGTGFHTFLVLKFRKAEERLYTLLSSELTNLFETTVKGRIHDNFSNYTQTRTNSVGNVPSMLGRVLDIKQHHKDTRYESKSTPRSFHLSGLAIDINYDTNPWVKDSTGLSLLKKAAPSLVSTQQSTAQKYFQELALAYLTGTGDIYDLLNSINEACKIYIKSKRLPIDWGFSESNNREGFLNHRKELVVVLRDEMSLAWGALDIGYGPMGNGDMMHFDMRISVIGQAFFNSKSVGKSSSIDYLKTVHPFFRSAYVIPPRTFEPIDLRIPTISTKSLMREIEAFNREFEAPTDSPYSGLDLKNGDSDSKKIYEGQKRTDVKGNPVRQLQNDLKALGIGLIGTSGGGFDFNTECAVREFQIYAKMPQIAQQLQGASQVYGDTFFAVPNTDRYKGDVNGVAESEVRRLIQVWLYNSWRIPVIVQTWTIKNNQRDKIYNGYDNIWKYNEVTTPAPRMYVRDFTGYYTFPATRNPNDLVVVGDGAAGGPEVRNDKHSWSETEFTTQDIFNGLAYSQLIPAEQSTFKVIRAIANAEANGGFLDRINGEDDQYISYGPYHWTLEVGEFPSFLAFLKERAPADFEKAVGFFGIDINKVWNWNGQDLFMSGSQRKFANGRFKILKGTTTTILNPLSENWGNYFRNWHFFYRFVMAARTIPTFRTLTYDFAKMRIRDVMAIPINNFGFIDKNKNKVNPTIGDIFRSEKSFAMVLRLHVFRPTWVGDINTSDNPLRKILSNSMTAIKNYDFSTWTDVEERILIDKMRTFRGYPKRQTDVHTTLEGVNDFWYSSLPNGHLGEQRTFTFDSVNVPTIRY